MNIIQMKENVASFIEEHIVAIVSTCDGLQPNGVPILYLYIKDDDAFYFLTKNNTRKHVNIENNNKASLTVFAEDPPTVFTADCVAEVFDFQSEKYREHVNKLVAIHSSQKCYPTPISTLKDGNLSLIKMSVENCKLESYKNDIDLLRANTEIDSVDAD